MYDGIKENPYKIEEVLENKVWKVLYRAEDFAVTKVANRKMQGMFFGDPETPAYQNKLLASARKYGEACEEQVKKVILLNLDGRWFSRQIIPHGKPRFSSNSRSGNRLKWYALTMIFAVLSILLDCADLAHFAKVMLTSLAGY